MNEKKRYLLLGFLILAAQAYYLERLHGKEIKTNAIHVKNATKINQVEKIRDPFATESTAPLISPTLSKPLFKRNKRVKEEDLETLFIKLRYANAANVIQLIERNGGKSLLSEQGSIGFDERTNIIILKEGPEQIKEITEIIHRIDVPVRQVQIEARIAIINEGNIEELGVRWGVSSKKDHLVIGGSIEGIAGIGSSGDESSGSDISDYLNVNLGSTSVNSSSIAFQIAKLSSATLLDLELSALQSESKAEVISSPRLLTMNKKPAYIEQGTEIPYLESSESGAATVKFRKAVLSLKVTPQVVEENQIILDLLVTQDRPGQIVKTGTGEAVAVDTQRIDTQVIVNNGETIVLGGIFQTTNIRSVDKVPLLGDIPIVGRLFRRNYDNEMKRELLIFVTPKIIDN